MQTRLATATWVRPPPVHPNLIGMLVGFLFAAPALFLFLSLGGSSLPEGAIQVGGMSIGFTCLAAGVFAVRAAYGRRAVPLVVTEQGLVIGARTIPAGNIERVLFGTKRHEVPMRPGARPDAMEDTALEVRLLGGATIKLLAMDQHVTDVAAALAPLERTNPALVVLPDALGVRDPARARRTFFVVVGLLVVGGVGFFVVRDEIDRRARAKWAAAETRAAQNDPALLAMLARIQPTAQADLGTCPAIDVDPLVIDERWRAWLTASRRDYAKEPYDVAPGSRAFAYVAGVAGPRTYEELGHRASLVATASKSPTLVVLSPTGDATLHDTTTGEARCRLDRSDADRIRETVAIDGALARGIRIE